jgi:hypothetical protein
LFSRRSEAQRTAWEKSLSQARGGRVKYICFASRHRRLTISPARTNVAHKRGVTYS